MNNYLVVDDDETTLKIICLMIKDIEPKAVIKTARNSKEGLIICQHINSIEYLQTTQCLAIREIY